MNEILSVGLILMAALVAGHLAQLAKVPEVTGYLLIGVLIGPAVLDLISHENLLQGRRTECGVQGSRHPTAAPAASATCQPVSLSSFQLAAARTRNGTATTAVGRNAWGSLIVPSGW